MDVDKPHPSPSMRKGKARKKGHPPPYPADMNPKYQSLEFKQELEKSFKSAKEMKNDDGSCLYVHPFKVCSIPNFIKDPKFVEGLRDELLDQIFHEKSNDLYKFQQSDDLKKISSPYIRTIRKLFQEEVCDWMQEVTGITLNNKVAMTCSRYDYTDVLLCHDDELDTRRIAFILYLVPPWKEEDGGALDLFDMDEHLQPRDIVRSLLPAWNTLNWFEVTEASHHQVAEVLSKDKTRLSINGWFHGPIEPRQPRYVEPSRPLQPYGNMEEESFYEWINPVYLDPEVQGQIQEKFEVNSEINLQEFIRDEKYAAVMAALQEERIRWTRRTPANKRRYSNAEEDTLPDILRECLDFLRSEPMFLTLSNLTGLSLHELAPPQSDSEDADTPKQDNRSIGSGEGCSGQAQQDGEDKDSDGETSAEIVSTPKKKQKLNSDNAKIENENESKESSKPVCRAEVRRWQHGDYMLVHDTDTESFEYALDATLFFGCKDWNVEYGGITSYIAKDEDEELLTVVPAENSLALVYRDRDTMRFVKHINHLMFEGAAKEFYDFSVVYHEKDV